MERKNLLGETTKIPRFNKGSKQKHKSRRSQPSVGSFFCEVTSEGRRDLFVSGMKLRI